MFGMIFKSMKNNEKMLEKIPNMPNDIRKNIRKALYKIGTDLHRDTVGYLNQTPKHGRKYSRPKSKGVGRLKKIEPGTYAFEGKRLSGGSEYTASAPGEAPAVVSGKLRASIGFSVIGSNSLTFGINNLEVPYAAALEYKDIVRQKGQVSRKIKPRPYISEAYKKNQPRIIKELKLSVEQVVKDI